MRKALAIGAACILLADASQGSATIQAFLENPGEGQDVSGIGLFFGWAFSDTGAPVTVRPRIDGTTQDIVVPCCGPREDVFNAGIGAPLETGFGALIPFSGLTAGPHTIGAEISAPGETTVIMDHSVVNAQPGGTVAVQDFDLSGARVGIDDDEIVIAGALASPGTRTNVRARYFRTFQSLSIAEAFNQNQENTARFNAVQSIFSANCALSGCHAGPSPAQAQNLAAGQSFANIVAVASTEAPTLLRVSPGRPDRSYLVQKIEGTAAVGARMPLGMSPLSAQQISTIRDWILNGAVPPQ